MDVARLFCRWGGGGGGVNLLMKYHDVKEKGKVFSNKVNNNVRC